jgi:short subunit fatty acids transporter
MLVFGIDIPLVEIIFALAIILVILMIEAIVIIAMMAAQLQKVKKIDELTLKLSDTILAIKKAEIDELDRLKRK